MRSHHIELRKLHARRSVAHVSFRWSSFVGGLVKEFMYSRTVWQFGVCVYVDATKVINSRGWFYEAFCAVLIVYQCGFCSSLSSCFVLAHNCLL